MLYFLFVYKLANLHCPRRKVGTYPISTVYEIANFIDP
jgi:hypothetical protein